jgi:hypothetical protein
VRAAPRVAPRCGARRLIACGAGTCTLADLDGPFVTLRLMGRFWHPRGMVLARVAQYMQTRIPVRGCRSG